MNRLILTKPPSLAQITLNIIPLSSNMKFSPNCLPFPLTPFRRDTKGPNTYILDEFYKSTPLTYNFQSFSSKSNHEGMKPWKCSVSSSQPPVAIRRLSGRLCMQCLFEFPVYYVITWLSFDADGMLSYTCVWSCGIKWGRKCELILAKWFPLNPGILLAVIARV